MKQTIRLNESQFNELIKETVKRVINEQFTQGGINNAVNQWQQQGLQQIRQNNGENRGYVVNQIGNNFFHSIPQENAVQCASVLINKAQYFYKYLMNNDVNSACQVFENIQNLVESIYENLEKYYQEQENIQKVGGQQWN